MISIIAAMDRKRGMGFWNKLPWDLPDELARFREIIRGHPVIMGRKTHEAIGRLLPGRKNIIITRNPDYKVPGGVVVGSIEEALKEVKNDGEIFVIGGAEIYKLALPYADKMYLTFIDAELPADTFFPEFNESDWRVTKVGEHGKDEKHACPFVYKNYERKK